MKFIIMTSPALGNNFVKELIVSGLKPEFIVTESPYFIKNNNNLSYPFKKLLKFLKFFKNKGEIQKKYQPYFLAKKYDIPIISSDKANSRFMEKKIKEAEIDYVFTFIFRILKPHIFSAPKKGSINFHPSDLPFNRGATPWNWLIYQQKKNTKISFHYISKGIDSGLIIKQYDVPIPILINSSILREYLFNIGSLFYIKLIYELKLNLLPDPKENDLPAGSYERPFNKNDTNISIDQTFNEMTAIINASRDTFYNASFEHENNNYGVVNFIELTNYVSDAKKSVILDEEGNLVVKTSDNKCLLLITNKTNLKLK